MLLIFEVLRDYAQEHGWTACNFGCSFFPTEPEHRITFQVKLSGVGTQECRLRVVDHQLGLGDPPEKTGRLHTGPDMKRYNILIRWIHAWIVVIVFRIRGERNESPEVEGAREFVLLLQSPRLRDHTAACGPSDLLLWAAGLHRAGHLSAIAVQPRILPLEIDSIAYLVFADSFLAHLRQHIHKKMRSAAVLSLV